MLHTLKASPRTVRVGLIDAAFPPVLAIDSGDEVDLETWQLWGDAVKPDSSYADVVGFRARYANCGPHSITGPIEIRGARAGGALKVEVLSYRLRDHGFNVLLPRGTGRGLLADEVEGGEIRHFALDTERMTTRFGPGVTIPLRPFLGILGVAPAQDGAQHSSAPGDFGGNIDCPELVAGSTLYLPVWRDGVGFYAGDAHAVQGCGEVCQTALETAMHSAHLRLSVLPQLSLARPRIETPSHLVTLGFDTDLREAARQATSDMVAWLCHEHGFTQGDAYSLCSLQCDLMITQIVNGTNGVHARLARALLEHRG